MQKPVAIILGRPNVGKSTLYNRISIKKKSLVDSISGLTRDYQISEGIIINMPISIIDTAGLENLNLKSSYSHNNIKKIISFSNIILFLIDATKELTSEDIEISKFIRLQNKKVILVANKCELKSAKNKEFIGNELGFGLPIMISAKNYFGFEDLKECFEVIFPKYFSQRTITENKDDSKGIRLVIVGKPNTGKSTLFNLINGYYRSITGPEPGLTRDSVETNITLDNDNFVMVDTAGLRRKSKVINQLEEMTSYVSRREIRYANVVLLVVDSTELFSNQDLAIARYAEEEGRALLIVLNKWDLVKNPKLQLKKASDSIKTSLSQIKGLVLVKTSALKGTGKSNLIKKINVCYELWNKRITTSSLNNWLNEISYLSPYHKLSGKSIKLRYVMQINIRPPTFLIFCNFPNDIRKSFKRFLTNNLRNKFGFEGVPIRIIYKKADNPYIKR